MIIGCILLLTVAYVSVSRLISDDVTDEPKTTVVSSETRSLDTPRPTATPTPLPGLDVTRASFLSMYEDDLGFDCQSAPLNDGRERVICESPHGNLDALVEVIGPENNITSAHTIVIDPQKVVFTSFFHLRIFIQLAVPEWEGGTDWIADNMQSAIDGDEPRARHGNASIEMDWGNFGIGASEKLSVNVSAN